MKYLLISLLFLSSLVYAKPNACNKQIKIAVIDTGFGYHGVDNNVPLCNVEHKDFTKSQMFTKRSLRTSYPTDTHGHGTNIIGLISRYAAPSRANYCIIVIKFWTPEFTTARENNKNSLSALTYAISLKPDIINYSAGGEHYLQEEATLIKSYLDQGGMLVAAAGNEGKELGVNGNYYPAMLDPRIMVVGNKNWNESRVASSNYGKLVKAWEYGVEREALGVTMTGTSQATAIATGKIIGVMSQQCDRK